MNQSNQDNGTIQKDATRLDRIVDAFEEAWRAGNRPDIDWYLPADVSLRQLALIKLVHIDLENRFRSGEKVRVETYLDIYPEIAGDTGVELVAWEVALRRRDEPDLRPEEYRRRLPQYADRIDAVFAATDSFFNKKKLSIPPETVDEVSVRSPSRVSSLAPQPAAGTATVQIPGYEILGLLGRGGMGIVFKARHAKLQRLVALKMMLAGSHADEKDLGRFRTEAEAVARLQHPNIVQIHDIGEHEGKPYFSLEFCAGGSLNKKLDGTPLQPMEAAKLIETLARAIHAAHQQHVIHRDLKPANVLLTEDGTPKITDFGLAKKLDDVGQTQSGAVMGTPSYMAPEQASGKTGEIGATTDVYALGAILYELLTGRTPFRRHPAGYGSAGLVGRPGGPSQAQPQDSPGSGNYLHEMFGEAARQALCRCRGAGGGSASLSSGRADFGAARVGTDQGDEVGQAAAGTGGGCIGKRSGRDRPVDRRPSFHGAVAHGLGRGEETCHRGD